MTTRRRILQVLALTAFAATAAAAAPRVAVLSPLGDRVLVVGSEISTGSHLDRNRRDRVALPSDYLDIAAATAFGREAGGARAGLEIVPVRTRDAVARQMQDDVVAGRRPATDIAARLSPGLAAQGFTHLVLLTRHRGDARIRVPNGTIGTGRLEGLGFYVDRYSSLRDIQDGDAGLGFLAPFAYVRASLVDLRTGALLAEEASQEAEAIPTLAAKDGAHPWDVLGPDEKAGALAEFTARGLAIVAPRLLARLPDGR